MQPRPLTSSPGAAAAEVPVAARSAGLDARIQPTRAAAVARTTRAELRRVLGPIVDVLDDAALRRHPLPVLAAGEGLAMKNRKMSTAVIPGSLISHPALTFQQGRDAVRGSTLGAGGATGGTLQLAAQALHRPRSDEVRTATRLQD